MSWWDRGFSVGSVGVRFSTPGFILYCIVITVIGLAILDWII